MLTIGAFLVPLGIISWEDLKNVIRAKYGLLRRLIIKC